MELPENGFYYHYKRDPAKGEYEVVGVARNTEDGSYLVLYRPLYDSEFLGELQHFARPLEMFMEDVTKDGITLPRFTKITDPERIEKLKEIRKQMYGN
ncbi:MAG TPA: DUF1653 domain-containing protein [Candidatus Paceibacterota bacterium]|nr:DUF1653 domain-containing protein [Candidatus Paceibacterota bacterium]